MLNLDTHILIYALVGRLTAKERAMLGRDSSWHISAIVLWEITKLSQLKKIDFDLETPVMKELLLQLSIIPLDEKVCAALKRLDFKSDPADELIAAASLAYDIPLITRDKRINKSKVVPIAM